MADGDSTWFCNNAGHPHTTYDAAMSCDLEAHRKKMEERARAEMEARMRKMQEGK